MSQGNRGGRAPGYWERMWDAERDRRITGEIQALDLRVQAALLAADRAVAKAEAANDKRFEGIPATLIDRLGKLEGHDERKRGVDQGIGVSWAAITGAIAILIAITSLIINLVRG